VTGRYRVGDIRHCFADIGRARGAARLRAAVSLRGGMQELVGWLREQERPQDAIAGHAAELAARGLTR
jgi:dTDP-L-rhamnose 4-epimerase